MFKLLLYSWHQIAGPVDTCPVYIICTYTVNIYILYCTILQDNYVCIRCILLYIVYAVCNIHYILFRSQLHMGTTPVTEPHTHALKCTIWNPETVHEVQPATYMHTVQLSRQQHNIGFDGAYSMQVSTVGQNTCCGNNRQNTLSHHRFQWDAWMINSHHCSFTKCSVARTAACKGFNNAHAGWLDKDWLRPSWNSGDLTRLFTVKQ